jgi:hypothetical protein
MVDSNRWEADLSTLSDGEYFVSVGRPRGTCDLYLDNTKVDTTMSVYPKIRSQLTLSHGFRVNRPSMTPLGQ